MKIPHIIDYYSGDEALMSMPTILCVIIAKENIRRG